MVGRFSRSRQGYGFVRPVDARPTDRDADIRVPLVASADAADGDTVRVKITKERHVGRPDLSGEVVEVTYLVRKQGGRGAGWTVATASLTVGGDGRAELRLGR